MSGYYPTRAALANAAHQIDTALDRLDDLAEEFVEADLGTQRAPLVSPGAQDWLGREARPLDSILAAAERVEDATGRLQGFVETFYGSLYPEPSEGDPGVCYNDHIKRLIAALDSLDVVIGKVREIG